MKPALKFACAVAVMLALVLAVLAAYLAIVWHNLDASERAAFEPLLETYADTSILLIVMLALALGLALAPLVRTYVVALLRLAQGTRLIATGNAAHRLLPEGSAEAQELAAAINLLAERHENTMREAQSKIGAARRAVEQDKNQLAALMGELAHSVIVCNLEGRVLLYNTAAREAFAQPGPAPGTTLLGLGRSVFALVDRALVAHGLDRLREQAGRGVARPVAHFVTSTANGALLRTQMTPVRGPDEAIEGYILTCSDAGGELASAERRDELLQSLTEGARATLANVQAAAEAMGQVDERDTPRRNAFLQVIREETGSLAQRLHRITREHAEQTRSQWPLEDMRATDLAALARRHMDRVDAQVQVESGAHDAWVRVDSYALAQLLAYLARRLRATHSVSRIFVRVGAAGGYAHVDVCARAPALAAAAAAGWDTTPLAEHGELGRRTVRHIVERHGGEAWYQHTADGVGYFRVLLPVVEPHALRPLAASPAPHHSRPEFYDFDLFQQSAQTAALENRPLTDLAYTVFDTETTGLAPSGGDEIVSIGAVRIVNGRLLAHEAFEQLIDPRRALSPGSARITGIDAAMLKGQPTIEAVLPLFHRYCEDTVLVAHNAAFDMRFLQVKQAATGVCFTQPVLDTLLLSAVLHPALESHQLEAIAERHGVNIIGRHTALGDAMVTAEVFLKMIPQLAERGISTLSDAQAAARRTFYARVRY